jgi:hypothetical protein
VKKFKNTKEANMKRNLITLVLSGALISLPLLAQDKKDMPMKEGMSMKHEGTQGGMMTGKMKEMHEKMEGMKKGMGGMLKGKVMMRDEDMKGMGKMMGGMSGMMGEIRQMMESGKITHEEMEDMSKMMGDMSEIMKQMSERMGQGTKKTR